MSRIKSGFVGLVGTPNSGKSSFLNYMIKEKISIVTPKPQTTRRRVVGIYPHEEHQIVFVDTPGFIQSTSGLNPFLIEELENVIKDSDVLLAVLSLDEKSPDAIDEILKIVTESRKPWMAIINKADLSDKSHRISIIQDKVKTLGGKCWVGSTIDKNGISKDEIVNELVSLLPEAEGPLFDSDLFTTSSIRDLCSEIVREKCFEFLHQEIPYSLAVKVMKFDETGKLPKITFEILVSKESHKALVIGKKGEMLKKIGSEARKEIEKLMDSQVFIQIHVSYKANWMKNKNIMKELGYVIPVE